MSAPTLKGLKENKFFVPTEIQRESIGYSLRGEDILGAAKTGSGKTLAFLIPVSKPSELFKVVVLYLIYLSGIGNIVLQQMESFRGVSSTDYNSYKRISISDI